MKLTLPTFSAASLWTIATDALAVVTNVFGLSSTVEQHILAVGALIVTGFHVHGLHIGKAQSPRS